MAILVKIYSYNSLAQSVIPFHIFINFFSTWTITRVKHSTTHKFSQRSTFIQNNSLKNEKIFFHLQSAEKQFSGHIPGQETAVWHSHALCRAAQLQEHVCIFINTVLTLFHLPKIAYFSPKKHIASEGCSSVYHCSAGRAYSVVKDRSGHFALVNTE